MLFFKTANYNNKGITVYSIFLTDDEIVVDEVWEVIFEDLSFNIKDWKQIMRKCCMDEYNNHIREMAKWDVIGNQENEEKEFIKKCLLNKNISWKCLKIELNRLGKENIITDFCQKTYITKGMLNVKIKIYRLLRLIYRLLP